MKFRLAITLAIFLLAASAQTTLAQGIVMEFTVDGVKREALVFAPAPTTSKINHPLIFAWHGHGGNMQTAEQGMHLETLWPAAIVVYPQGLNTPSHVDPQGNKPGWEVEANQAAPVGNRDLRFFDVMLATLHQKYSIDNERIYSTGFSNGAIFSYLLWAERSNVIAAIGEVAGRLWDTEHLTQPRAVLAIAGKADTTDPFALQQQTIETDRQADNATGPGQQCPVPNGAATGTACTRYPSTTQTPVKTLIHPGGHVYPPWAPQEIVEFLKLHKHP